jgi:L-ribulose-5-phosphate 3-epimerase
MYEKAVPETYSLSEMLKIGKDTGYDFFEISIDRTKERIERLFDKDLCKKLVHSIEKTDFLIGSMCLSALGTYTLGNSDKEIEKKALNIFYHAVDFAERLGIRIIQIPACDVPKNATHTEETDRKFIENLQRAIEYSSAHSVMIGLENMEDSYMDKVEKCMRIVQRFNSPYFCLYPDSGNIVSASKLYKTDIYSDMISGRNKYCAFHLKETKPGKYGGLFYGDGHVDFQNIMDITWNELGIRRYVLEYWYTGNPKWEKDLIIAQNLCKGWINLAEKGASK